MRSVSWIKVSAVACVAIGLGSIVSLALAADEAAKPKHTIKEVMKIAHNKTAGLLKKVSDGGATAEEKQQLLDLYISLTEGEPSKGEKDSWHKLAGGAMMAAAKVVVGREGAIEELKTATNCAACHKLHKGS